MAPPIPAFAGSGRFQQTYSNQVSLPIVSSVCNQACGAKPAKPGLRMLSCRSMFVHGGELAGASRTELDFPRIEMPVRRPRRTGRSAWRISTIAFTTRRRIWPCSLRIRFVLIRRYRPTRPDSIFCFPPYFAARRST